MPHAGKIVAVQGIHEAALSVYSGGGDITLGSIKASDVILDAGETPALPSTDGHVAADSDISAEPGIVQIAHALAAYTP